MHRHFVPSVRTAPRQSNMQCDSHVAETSYSEWNERGMHDSCGCRETCSSGAGVCHDCDTLEWAPCNTCERVPCRADGDEMAVLDAQARVRGVSGLRVVDASIMPSVPCANTNLTAIMIAEKMADKFSQLGVN